MIEVDRYEKIWIWVSLGTLAVFLVAVVGSVLGTGIHLPGAAGQINLAAAQHAGMAASQAPNAPDFDQPGLRVRGSGIYDLYLVAQTWNFTPNEIRIPAGSTVNIYATSRDVQHGLMILDTNVNLMLLPGQVSKVSVRFNRPGTYPFVCHEYCGIGHQAMSGTFIIE